MYICMANLSFCTNRVVTFTTIREKNGSPNEAIVVKGGDIVMGRNYFTKCDSYFCTY